MQTSRGREPPDAQQQREEETAHDEGGRVQHDEPLPPAPWTTIAALMVGVALRRGTPLRERSYGGLPQHTGVGMQTAPLRGPCGVKEEATVTAQDRHTHLQVQTGTARAVRSAIRVRPKYLPSILRGALLAKNTCASGTVWQPSRWGKRFPCASSYTGP